VTRVTLAAGRVKEKRRACIRGLSVAKTPFWLKSSTVLVEPGGLARCGCRKLRPHELRGARWPPPTTSCRRPLVTMVESSYFRELDHLAQLRSLHAPRHRGIAGQR
jgi:hypothetical protein